MTIDAPRVNGDAIQPELTVDDLSVEIATPAGALHAVSHVSLAVAPGETLCLVGESGCGKTMTALSLLRLQPASASITAARIAFRGQDLQALDERQFARLRGNRLAMIFQDPMTALNPVYTIGNQLKEVYLRHRSGSPAQARERAEYLLDRCGVSQPKTRLRQYPHELSGGLRQRMMIAMALMCGPTLIVADEPTTALDVTVQAQIMLLLKDLQREFGLALLLITHDLGVVAHVADRVAVMYAGRIVEAGPVRDILSAPLHPYTRGLLGCIPSRFDIGHKLGTIPGLVPTMIGPSEGCSFRNRCAIAIPDCAKGDEIALTETAPGRAVRCVRARTAVDAPPIVPEQPDGQAVAHRDEQNVPVLSCRAVEKTFAIRGVLSRQPPLRAVDGVDLDVRRGEVLAIVGESGSGKTTLGRMMLGLMQPSGGSILLNGEPLDSLSRLDIARQVQPVFQDPYSSLNPRKTVAQIVGLPLAVQGLASGGERRARVEDIVQRVGLARRLLDSYPVQMSGGQRQRVAIARALVVQPRIVILDEPTSALDVSIQAQILNLLQDLRARLALTYIFITHDLGVVRHMADRVAVMQRGRIVETGPCAQVLEDPRHDYTKTLIRSVLSPDPLSPRM